MVYPAATAAADFAGRVELIDLRTISPWDREAVLGSVRKTGRCLVVHEDGWTAGFGAEILATLAEEAFFELDAPLRRVAVRDVPIPYSVGLMSAVLPNAEQLAAAIADLLAL
jgi:2-oxoisovalerate dehydrogenase E1 component